MSSASYNFFLEFYFKPCLKPNMSARTALKKALDAAGGPSALARAIRVKPQAISQWDKVPAAQVLKVERVTGVPRHELRPDFYPPPAQAAE